MYMVLYNVQECIDRSIASRHEGILLLSSVLGDVRCNTVSAF